MPTATDTPATAAAFSLASPRAIACQNGHRAARCKTGGRPGERSFARRERLACLFFTSINTPIADVLRRRVEFGQYTSVAFGERCKKMGVRPSMGTVGDAYDNAMAESFFATLECELIDRRSWQTKIEARLAMFTYIEGWYNPRRRHSALGQISPAKFERSHLDKPHAQPSRLEHDLTTVGACVACATSPVDKSAQELTDTRTPRGGLENMRAGAQCRGAIMEGPRSSRPERQKRCVSRANS